MFSIGQPPLWDQHAAALAPIHGRNDRGAAWLSYGVYHPVFNPVTGMIGWGAEAYAAVDGRPFGARLAAESKLFGIAGGVDWDLSGHSLAPFFRFQTAVRRGGLFGRGTKIRLDWLPTRGQSVAVGVSIPVFRPLAGRTRPRQTHVSLAASRVDRDAASTTPSGGPRPLDVRDLLDAATTIGAYSNAYTPRAERIISHPDGGYAGAIAAYDSSIRRLFTVATGNAALGARIAEHGRIVLLDRVLLPLDSLFGQAESNPRDLSPLTDAAIAAMSRWLVDTARVASGRSAALDAYAAWMGVIARVHADLLRDAGESRLAWMPLELALTADQYDEQSEVDSLIARAVGHPFTDGNALTYLRSTDLPLEIARSIYAARSYHVLWTHDMTGRLPTGAIDNIAYSMVADAYLPAITAAVKRYDSTGVMPTYIILQDEYWYDLRSNRIWMDILENPLDASMRLPGGTAAEESHLRQRQTELRAAVAGSARLQRDAAASGDAHAWLHNVVSVHVNIVQPRDFSFRSGHIVPGVPFAPDNLMRDHRKIVFYDLTEAEPYRGALLLMGIGIGEHYASATWEDRGYRIRGPATLEVRRAVRAALLRNGFSERQIPPPLREVASTKRVEQQMNQVDYVGRALQVHNRVGFGRKESSVARAMLYDLAPAGSVLIVPDPMWLSETWAGMLVGAAARGCQVYVVAPAIANAPSPQAPLMAEEHAILSRLLVLRRTLGPALARSKGVLRVGVFAAHASVDDAAGRAREVRDGLARAPWIRELIPFDEKTLALLNRAQVQVTSGADATSLAHDVKPRAPQLHQKSQLIARPGAITALVRQPGWDVALARSMRVQSQETSRFADQLGYTEPDVDTTATRSTDTLIRGYEQTLPESERKRVSFYFSLGSQNEDPRGIDSDGEVSLIVSGVQAAAGVVDLFYLMARSTWIENEQALDRLVPPPSRLAALIARRFKAQF